MDLQWRMNNNHYKSVISILFEEDYPYTKQTKILQLEHQHVQLSNKKKHMLPKYKRGRLPTH
jgi:hypothetical protein